MYLAIDTSSDNAGLAVIRDGQILAECNWRCGHNHTVELLPHLESLLRQSSLDIKDIRGIIVARGPGSFNGLRVGLGTAKGLAFSLGVPIIGISALEAAAYQHAECGLPVCPVFNAGKGEVAYAVYQLSDGEWRCLSPESLTTIDELCNRIKEPTIFCGEPTEEMIHLIQTRLGEKAEVPVAAAMLRRAGFLAALGEERLMADICDDAATLQPVYLRRPNISQPKSKSAGASSLQAVCQSIAVIWDMDGTIVDTAAQHLKAWQDVFAKRGITFGEAMFKKSFGTRNDDIIKSVMGQSVTGEEIGAISHEKNELFIKFLQSKRPTPMPGAVELLSELSHRGFKIAVASSAPAQNIALFLKMLGLENCFDSIVSGENVAKGKPDPEIFLTAAAKLRVEPGCCVVIEDAVAGIHAACSAGMRAIAVATNHPRDSLREADLVVDSLSGLHASDIEKLIPTCDTNKPNNWRST